MILNDNYFNEISLKMEIFYRKSFVSVHDLENILDTYYKITNKNYVDNPTDTVMISLLRQYPNEFEITTIQKYLVPYVKIISHITHQEIEIDYNAYKIDLIKKMLSSANDAEDILISIEYLLFS